MERAPFALVAVVAATVTATAFAGGSAAVKVPAPKVGQISVQLVTITVKAPAGKKAGLPKLKATNLAQLGQGFGGVTITKRPKSVASTMVYKTYILMFMGNASTSPASTVNVQVTPPAGDTATASKPQVQHCPPYTKKAVLAPGFEAVWALAVLGGESPVTEFTRNVFPTSCP